MNDFFKHRRGIAGTLFFHGGLLALLLIMKLTTPLPLPEEEGILVNFGDQDMGSGLFEPPKQSNNTPVSSSPAEEESSPPETSNEAAVIQDDAKEAAEELLTQDTEEAPVVKTEDNKKKQEELERKKREEEERERLAEQERIRKQQEEQERLEKERKAKEEAERVRKAEEERKRKEEAERKKREAEENFRNQLKDKMKNQFGTTGKNAQGQGNSEGERTGIGNQGVTTGSVDSKDHTKANSQGNGISYSLQGRSLVGSLQQPDFPGEESGIVVVEIIVDKDGRVVKATAGQKGTTIMKQSLFRAAEKAAMKTKFSKETGGNAPMHQKGFITYHFVLD